jgi:hypothetical protein
LKDGRKKVGVQANLYGTSLIFDEMGFLKNYDMGGDLGKASRGGGKNDGNEQDYLVSIDDDPQIASHHVVELDVGTAFWVEHDGTRREKFLEGLFKYPGKNSVVLDGSDKDPRIILDYVDRLRRGMFVAAVMPPRDLIDLRYEFAEMGKALYECKSPDADVGERGRHLETFLDKFNVVTKLGRPIVARTTNGLGDLYHKAVAGFETGLPTDEIIPLADEIVGTLQRQNPELRPSEEFDSLLRRLA